MKTKLLYLLLFICSYSYAQFPSEGLVRAYDFTNGSLNDIANNSVHFTQTGSAATQVNDRLANTNNAFSLNGDYLSANNIDYGQTGSSNNTQVTSTLSFWIKTSTNNSQIETIIDESQRATRSTWYGYYIYLENGKVKIDARYQLRKFYPTTINYHKAISAESTTVVADGNWHHIVVSLQLVREFQHTYSNEYTAKIYVNNVLEDTTFNNDDGNYQTPISHDAAVDFTIGNRNTGDLTSTEVYKDEIDDVLVYNRLLTTTEIQTLYNTTGVCISPSNAAFSVSSITDTSANIDVFGNDTYDIAYHKTSEAFTNATIISGVTSGTTNISSLDVDTSYDVYLRKQCTNSTSDWLNPISFKTEKVYTEVFVNKNATGNNDGTSWANAFTNLQDAITPTYATPHRIWVAKGTYKPHSTDRNASFVVKYSIYGGFAGNEVSFFDRDMSLIHTTNATILSGDLLNNDDATVDFNDATRTDNSKHVVEVTANNVVIDGFSIQDGYADAASGNDRFGGGIFKSLSVANLTVKNSNIKNNVALFGAAISVSSNVASNIIIDACTLEGNLANIAAGIDFHHSGTNGSLDISITNSLFNNNKTDDDASKGRKGSGAAAIRLRSYFHNVTLNANIINNTFVNNSSLGTVTNPGNFPVVEISRNGGDFGAINVANNIFWGNVKNNGALTKAIGKSSSSASSLTGTNSTIIVRNNTDEDGLSTISNTFGTSSTNPNLDANFNLSLGSTAVDTGDNGYVSTSKDLLNNARIFNTIVDRGAFESTNPIARSLTLTASNGTITTNPNPVNGNYNDGAVVTLTATPATGYQFDGWSGDVSGTANPINITMDANKTVTATFSPIQRTLTINATNGHVNVTGAANSKSQTVATNFFFDHGETTSMTAVPATGYQFSGWSGDASGNTNPFSLTMDANKTVTALFTPIQRTLTINATNGNVTTSPNPVNGTYDDGTVVTLTATANTGYGFVFWTGDISGTTNVTTITMNGDKTIEANFSTTASIKDANKIDVLVYPNPMRNFISIQLDEKIKVGKIIDVTGKEIKRFISNKVDTQNISSGIYILKIETESGKIAMKKIIKK